MWKIIPFFAVVAALGIGGVILHRDLKQRKNDLRWFLQGLHGVEREMTYASSALWLCFERAGESLKGGMRQVFLRTASLLRENADAEEAFSRALDEYRDGLALTDDDLEWMRRFGIGLGTSDMEHTRKALAYIEETAAHADREAEINEKKWGRVFLGGGWLFGLGAALVFI